MNPNQNKTDDQKGMITFAPKWYYRNTLSPEHQRMTREIMDEWILDDNNFHNPDNWLGSVGTTLNHESNPKGPWKEWFPVLEDVLRDFFENQMGLKEGCQPFFQECWANRYSKGHFQEFHNHAAFHCNLSMVYYYHLGDEHKEDFRLYNQEHSAYRLSGLDDTLHLPAFEVYKPKFNTGDLVIFPSHYPHLVAPNTSDEERITIAMNILVKRMNSGLGIKG